MKLCKDCKHFERFGENCLHPENSPQSVIDGERRPLHSAEFLRCRMNTQDCGIEGRWWEPKS